MEYALKTSRSARRGAVGLHRQGVEGRRGEMCGVARPGWLSALPSPPDGGEEDGEEDEAGRMTDSLRGCPSGCWSIGGEVVAMWYRWHHPEADRVGALPSP